jgi:glucose/arabinose dehydrogenase
MARTHAGASAKPAPIASRTALASALAAVLVACTTTPGSPSPAPDGSPPATPLASASQAPSPSATAAAPLDLAHLGVALEPYAVIKGRPLAIVSPPDGSGRLFVASQDGFAWVIRNGVTSAMPLLDVTGDLTTGGERGLLGIAVHPKFPSDPRVFVDYTDAKGNTVVSSFSIDAANPDSVDPESEQRVLQVEQPAANHNGGAVVFGPDGYLYVSFGDGGGGGSVNGQKQDTLLGKILRIDVDKPTGSLAYGIPRDNPFVGVPRSRPEIWLTGLRNPWRISFDRATGDLWIGDVGASSYEEIDVIRGGSGGANLGWNVMEGAHCLKSGCSTDGFMLPVSEYGRGSGCTVIGGVVYRGAAYPMLRGAYLFTDYCSGNLFAIDSTTTVLVAPSVVGTGKSGAAAFGEDAEGEVYLADLDGNVYRLTATVR